MDRINGLSDDLLIKILLLVPTKVAVSTSVLSKRWVNLWMWLPKLEYSNRHCPQPKCEKLQCFINRNMSLHRAPVIESFRLELRGLRFTLENINMWIVIAVSRSLRELEILYDSYQAKRGILPSDLFTCNSLVILKLGGRILLDVPRMVSLPSLKTLQLHKVKYFKDDTLQRLLSNCPILEDLEVELRKDDMMERVTVSVPSLQSLSIYILDDYSVDEVVIETPDLKYLKLRLNSYDDECCFIENMPYLIEAHIDVDLYYIDSVIGSNTSVKGLIGSITSVKRLTICSEAMLDEGFVFNRLEHLKICLCKHYSPKQLVRLLKASSNLQELHLSYLVGHYTREMLYWEQPSTVPQCMLSSLQSLDWFSYTGKRQERDIVVYILKHALHLKTAKIKSFELDVPKSEMLKELELSSRASAACQLMFE